MVNIEGKKKSLITFFVFLYLPSIAVFSLTGSSNLSQFISVVFYVCLTVASLAVLALMPNDEKYYRNMNLWYFLGAVGMGIGMIFLSWGLSLELRNASILSSVYQTFWFPIPGLMATSTLTLTPVASSVGVAFLGVALSGLVMAATAEELFRLPAFAYGSDEWKKGYKIRNLTVPGVLIYVGFPVLVWSALHGLQAYSNPVMIIPAAVNGVVLTIYLWRTHCILGAIFGHYVYNLGVTTISWLNGNSNVAAGTPFLPISIANLPIFIVSLVIMLVGLAVLLAVKNKRLVTIIGAVAMMIAGGFVAFRYGLVFIDNYFSNAGFIYDFLLVILFVGSFLFFLLPSITSKSKGEKT